MKRISDIVVGSWRSATSSALGTTIVCSSITPSAGINGAPMLAGRELAQVDLSHQPKLSGRRAGGPEVEPPSPHHDRVLRRSAPAAARAHAASRRSELVAESIDEADQSCMM
ncbi:MAG: hypothetical protein JWR37_1169 [Mycobacterium sp.]|nr:hypothetical protein [Mycobacterium sp.]